MDRVVDDPIPEPTMNNQSNGVNSDPTNLLLSLK
jgi:hypothetical protein